MSKKTLIEHFRRGTYEQEYRIPSHDKRRESSLFK